MTEHDFRFVFPGHLPLRIDLERMVCGIDADGVPSDWCFKIDIPAKER
jgi:hypothetical protein